MSTFKVAQVVKFKNPFPDEYPEQAFIVKEVNVGYENTRIDISPLALKFLIPTIT